jgi:uncharacterized protein (TIGR00730 family)
MRLCVFCGSSSGNGPAYVEAARAFGRVLAENDIGLVYGGARVGLMGAVADAALERDGEVVGVIPRALVDREIAHTGLSELRVVQTMHERKALMAELSDGFVALPGGTGTLDEFFEVWTWAQLGIHSKPCGLLNVGGYYDGLSGFLDHLVAEGFLRHSYRAMLAIEADPPRLLRRLLDYSPPHESKWSTSRSAIAEPQPAAPPVIDVVAWICVRDDRLLAARSRGQKVFYMPGGKREAGESDWHVLAREVGEELQLELRHETLSLVGLVEAPAHGHRPGTKVRMICYAAEPVGELSQLRAAAEVEQLAWLSYGDRRSCAPAARAVLEILHARGLIH